MAAPCPGTRARARGDASRAQTLALRFRAQASQPAPFRSFRALLERLGHPGASALALLICTDDPQWKRSTRVCFGHCWPFGPSRWTRAKGREGNQPRAREQRPSRLLLSRNAELSVAVAVAVAFVPPGGSTGVVPRAGSSDACRRRAHHRIRRIAIATASLPFVERRSRGWRFGVRRRRIRHRVVLYRGEKAPCRRT